MADTPRTRVLALSGPLDLAGTLGGLVRSGRDRTMRVAAVEVWRATRTPDGPASLRLRLNTAERRLEGEAWGPGAERVLDGLDALVGEPFDCDAFVPTDPLVRDLCRRFAGVRLPRTGAVVEALVPTILEQKVVGNEARASYAQLVRLCGDDAPGPLPLRLPPDPVRLVTLPSFVFHRAGVERHRASIIRSVASVAARMEEAATMPLVDAYRRLRAVPGVGPWTAACVGQVAFGDDDAVPVGDYHLPHTVSWVLAGEPRGDDARMLELLEPFRPYRGRVVRLMKLAGMAAPRRGPLMPLRNLAAD